MLVTIMMSIAKFLVLAIGFGLGYWLITTAGREEKWKKILGAIFGWILIIYSIAIAAMICFQWINFMHGEDIMYKCPMMRQKMYQQPGMPKQAVPEVEIEIEREQENQEK